MSVPVFVNHGAQLTDEGKAVMAHIKGLIEAAGKDANKLNALPGYAKQYFVYASANSMTEGQFLEEFRFSLANTAYNDVVRLQEATKSQEQEAAKDSKIVESLEKFGATLDDIIKRLDALEQPKAKPGKTAEPPAPAAETPATDTESEA